MELAIDEKNEKIFWSNRSIAKNNGLILMVQILKP